MTTYLAAEQHRDADTWGVHLLDAAERGLRPDYTIADAGWGLRDFAQLSNALKMLTYSEIVPR